MVTNLNQTIEELKKDSSIKNSEYRAKIMSANKLTEKYQKIAKVAVDKYIASQAVKVGVSVNEIKNRLSENYSFEEIDKVCSDLSSYKVNMSRLPFELQESIQQRRVKVTHDKDPILPDAGLNDDVDEWLINQVNQ